MEKTTIRIFTENDLEIISKIHVDSWKYTYKGIVPDEILEKMTYGNQKEKWEKRLLDENKNDEKMYVFEENDKVVGFASGSVIDDASAIINTLYFDCSAQKKGYGKALFHHIRKVLDREKIEVWCLEENKSKGFYEKMGGRPQRVESVKMGSRVIQEVQYIF